MIKKALPTKNKRTTIIINNVLRADVTPLKIASTIAFDNKNKIVKLADLPEFIDGNYIRKEGCSYATIYLREYAGVDPNDGRPMYYDNKEDENGNRSRNIVYDPNDADRVELKDIYPN